MMYFTALLDLTTKVYSISNKIGIADPWEIPDYQKDPLDDPSEDPQQEDPLQEDPQQEDPQQEDPRQEDPR